MRKGLSLIELIFTIVIIAIVFIVIPKVVFALKKSDNFAIRQDAILNSVSFMQMLSKLSWDEENVDTKDILHVSADSFPCNPTSRLRIGGFVGSRDCLNNITVLVGSFGTDGEVDETTFDDIDDFNNFDFNTSTYNIHIAVNYVNDFSVGAATTLNVDLGSNDINTTVSTNLKRVDVTTNYIGNRGAQKELMEFSYTSANIGQLYLHKRVWE